jgi:hypothetical protein
MATPVVALGLGWLVGWPDPVIQGAMVGSWVSLLVSGLAIVALRPNRPRPMADWMILWLGATTIRILFTPLGLLSVYFAAPLPGTAVLLGGLAAYLVALAVESSILALFAGRAVPPPDSSGSAVDDGGSRS